MARLDDHATTWPLEPHTSAKHEIMRRYLGGWFPILGSAHRRIVFIDGFAGPGVYDHGQHGSPVIALNTLLNHQAVRPTASTSLSSVKPIARAPSRLSRL